MARFRICIMGLCITSIGGGCHDYFVRSADSEVARLIETRQRAALGETHPIQLGDESGAIRTSGDMYDYAPHPIASDVPDAFKEATQPIEEGQEKPSAPSDSLQPTSPDSETAQRFTLAAALAFAQQYARELQTAKEDLYLSALALSLERFLWTPQLSGNLSFEFADYGQVRDFDRAMTAVATVAAEQRLPYGGTVTAQLIDTWMRDLGVHTTSGETGQMILSADIPLLRGAGKVARESLYQAERDLIYSVRDYERFRRTFVVDIAADFFQLLSLRAQIESAEAQVASLQEDARRVEALAKVEEIVQLEADRARVELLNARNRVASAQERYGFALDRFKIRLGMGSDVPLVLSDEPLDLSIPPVGEKQAIETAIAYRLDLLNRLDAIDDAGRGVAIARNNLLPDLNFSGSVNLDSDPDRHNTMSYNTERTTWRGRVDMEIPLNRQAERNDVRASYIDLRRTERGYDLFRDQVRAEVRQSLRQLVLAELQLKIQEENITINEFRRNQAATLFELGLVPSNRDKIEAENDLRDARNNYAAAESDYRRSILEFLLATGTLRIDDDGHWLTFAQNGAAGGNPSGTIDLTAPDAVQQPGGG